MTQDEQKLEAPRRASAQEMPILDLGPWLAGGPIGPVVEQFKAACTNTGFFYVKNHGVPQAVIDAVFDATRRYMSLPMEERLKDRIDERFRRGFMPMGVTQHPGHKPDLKESYELGMDLPLTDPDVAGGLPLHGPNRWPADKPWLAPAAMAYFDATIALGRNLLKIFASAVGKDEGFFLQYATKPMVQSRLFHYPPQESFTNLELGAAAHTDYGMLTVLAQDPIGGLELCTRGGEWVAAPYVEGTLVVNLGDLVKVWTNDVYVSNPHRVANRTGRERYSIPTFFNLDYDTPVACLPEFAPREGEPRHAPIKSGEYLVRRFAAVQKYKTPAELAAG
ncbi:isopenicillin N synthase family dioxygenase [Variovorax sp. RCC_210]|jgi:isopenicillin N synthase-like dioxygenase|uniref:isopenicillin N synthase family dioxygenase n=1 Tax=Variovorax sp. RCC_210 TaxID=3239217 RepID=UPI0035256D42